MPALATILGKFRGGSSNSVIRVFEEGGRTRAEYTGSAGGRAGFEGVLLEGVSLRPPSIKRSRSLPNLKLTPKPPVTEHPYLSTRATGQVAAGLLVRLR